MMETPFKDAVIQVMHEAKENDLESRFRKDIIDKIYELVDIVPDPKGNLPDFDFYIAYSKICAELNDWEEEQYKAFYWHSLYMYLDKYNISEEERVWI